MTKTRIDRLRTEQRSVGYRQQQRLERLIGQQQQQPDSICTGPRGRRFRSRSPFNIRWTRLSTVNPSIRTRGSHRRGRRFCQVCHGQLATPRFRSHSGCRSGSRKCLQQRSNSQTSRTCSNGSEPSVPAPFPSGGGASPSTPAAAAAASQPAVSGSAAATATTPAIADTAASSSDVPPHAAGNAYAGGQQSDPGGHSPPSSPPSAAKH